MTRTAAAAAAVVGGVLWALTPLRQPVFHAGRTPDEGELFFRGYNAVLVLVAVALTFALVRLRRDADDRAGDRAGRGAGRGFTVGWWTVGVGHLLIAVGSTLGVVLGGALPDVVATGQDLGFLGAVVAAAGALPLGAGGRRRGVVPRTAAAFFVACLPLGVAGMVLMAAAGAPEDVLGLPLTVLYGGAWVALGAHWASRPGRGR